MVLQKFATATTMVASSTVVCSSLVILAEITLYLFYARVVCDSALVNVLTTLASSLLSSVRATFALSIFCSSCRPLFPVLGFCPLLLDILSPSTLCRFKFRRISLSDFCCRFLLPPSSVLFLPPITADVLVEFAATFPAIIDCSRFFPGWRPHILLLILPLVFCEYYSHYLKRGSINASSVQAIYVRPSQNGPAFSGRFCEEREQINAKRTSKSKMTQHKVAREGVSEPLHMANVFRKRRAMKA